MELGPLELVWTCFLNRLLLLRMLPLFGWASKPKGPSRLLTQRAAPKAGPACQCL